MSREKQIEEMAKDICVAEQKTNYSCTEKCKKQGICAYCKVIAETLYEAGYRKQSEGEWLAKDNFNGRCSIATCSNCGTEKAFSILVRTETIATLYPYCQKCGAKMKGGAE